jgi:hypothetical protein
MFDIGGSTKKRKHACRLYGSETTRSVFEVRKVIAIPKDFL